MKKFLSLVFGLIMCLGCGIALAACGKVTLKSITIDSGLNRSVLVGEELGHHGVDVLHVSILHLIHRIQRLT